MKRRYFYPYCGYCKGFCLSKNSCTKKIPDYGEELKCSYWRAKHPVTNQVPQEL